MSFASDILHSCVDRLEGDKREFYELFANGTDASLKVLQKFEDTVKKIDDLKRAIEILNDYDNPEPV